MAKKKKPSASKKVVKVDDVEMKTDAVAEVVEEKVEGEEEAIPVLPEAEEITPVAEDSVEGAEVPTDNVEEQAETVAVTETKKSGAGPLILGGIIAAAIGFTAARSNVVDNFLPPSWRMNAGEVALQEQIVSSQDEIASLNKQLADLANKVANLPTTENETDPALVAQVQDLADRVSVVEDRPVVKSDVAPDFSDDFATLRDVAEQQQATIDAMLADARLVEQTSQKAASNTLARAAVTRITAAIESGAPFATALEDLEATGVTDIPDELKDAALDGVVTLASLQAMVPDAARAALSASPADADAGLGGFLKRQLGARSVTPKEGNDPDAILSRIEGATRQGHLTDALAEAESLSPEAKAAMSDWIESATNRLAVTSASEALLQRLAAN
ncbi:MAG: hypothetical protein ABJG56_01285 [Lentilitoribacter sp.]